MQGNSDTDPTMMLGIYTLDGDIPVEPEIVLSNCHDADALAQLVGMFSGNPDIRFFLLDASNQNALDLADDFHFLRDGGKWVLANGNTMHEVLFDDASFNPGGNEGTFSLIHLSDGSYGVDMVPSQPDVLDLPSSEHLIVDMPEHDLFPDGDILHAVDDSNGIFIDPSVLGGDQDEIVVTNFTFGTNHLELAEGLSIKDIVLHSDHDFTDVVIGETGHAGDDIVVRLLGVSQPDIPGSEYGMEPENTADDLIHHLIQSGNHFES